MKPANKAQNPHTEQLSEPKEQMNDFATEELPNLEQAPILVIGATGKTGKRVADKLETAGLSVRRGSRQAEIPFNWYDDAGWHAALAGVTAVYVSFFPDLAVPEAPATIRKFCTVARESGVQHIVLLSGRGEPAAQYCEHIVQSSGMQWNVVRASWFNQNFSEGEFAAMVEQGVIALPEPKAKEPFVDVEDIADVAVAALTRQCPINKVYELTGPQLLSFRDITEELSHALGRDIRFVPMPKDAFLKEMRHQQIPKETLELLMFLFTEVLDGRNAHTSDGVMQALGRPAKDFREFAASLAKEPRFNGTLHPEHEEA